MALIDFLLTQTCTITPWIREAEGADIYGEPEQRKCRIQSSSNLAAATVYIHPDGVLDHVDNESIMYCKGDPISQRSKVECDGQEFIVTQCYPARGFGKSHLEVKMR